MKPPSLQDLLRLRAEIERYAAKQQERHEKLYEAIRKAGPSLTGVEVLQLLGGLDQPEPDVHVDPDKIIRTVDGRDGRQRRRKTRRPKPRAGSRSTKH